MNQPQVEKKNTFNETACIDGFECYIKHCKTAIQYEQTEDQDSKCEKHFDEKRHPEIMCKFDARCTLKGCTFVHQKQLIELFHHMMLLTLLRYIKKKHTMILRNQQNMLVKIQIFEFANFIDLAQKFVETESQKPYSIFNKEFASVLISSVIQLTSIYKAKLCRCNLLLNRCSQRQRAKNSHDGMYMFKKNIMDPQFEKIKPDIDKLCDDFLNKKLIQSEEFHKAVQKTKEHVTIAKNNREAIGNFVFEQTLLHDKITTSVQQFKETLIAQTEDKEDKILILSDKSFRIQIYKKLKTLKLKFSLNKIQYAYKSYIREYGVCMNRCLMLINSNHQEREFAMNQHLIENAMDEIDGFEKVRYNNLAKFINFCRYEDCHICSETQMTIHVLPCCEKILCGECYFTSKTKNTHCPYCRDTNFCWVCLEKLGDCECGTKRTEKKKFVEMQEVNNQLSRESLVNDLNHVSARLQSDEKMSETVRNNLNRNLRHIQESINLIDKQEAKQKNLEEKQLAFFKLNNPDPVITEDLFQALQEEDLEHYLLKLWT